MIKPCEATPHIRIYPLNKSVPNTKLSIPLKVEGFGCRIINHPSYTPHSSVHFKIEHTTHSEIATSRVCTYAQTMGAGHPEERVALPILLSKSLQPRHGAHLQRTWPCPQYLYRSYTNALTGCDCSIEHAAVKFLCCGRNPEVREGHESTSNP